MSVEHEAFARQGTPEPHHPSLPQEKRPTDVGEDQSLPADAPTEALDLAAVEQILQAARNLFNSGCSWAKFYQEILGTDGLIHRLFPTRQSQTTFRRSSAYGEIQQMLAQLSRRRFRRRRSEQPIKIITVRVPESVHAELAREAALRGVSVNQLCIMKLVQLIEAEALQAASGTGQSAAQSVNAPQGEVAEQTSSASITEPQGAVASST